MNTCVVKYNYENSGDEDMRRHRKIRKRKRQLRVVIITCIVLIFLMASGYAAFQTNLSITAKGNVKNYNAAWQLKKLVVNNGDGLYIDAYEENRYVYKGETPNNYIEFNNELWRIIAIEEDDTLKIIKDEVFGPMLYDGSSSDNRYNENNTYCLLESNGISYSCNVWSSINGNFINSNYSGTVTEDADLNIYLNGEYYNELSATAQNQIQTHKFKIGGLPQNVTFQNYLDNDNKYIWEGKIGLMNLSDWFKASNNASCTIDNNDWCPASNYSREDFECSYNNYLYNDIQMWTLNPNQTSTRYVLAIGSYGCIGNASSAHYYAVYVRPVTYLKEDIKLTGDGTATNPYQIS